MTDEQLAELARLEAEATPGPWLAHSQDGEYMELDGATGTVVGAGISPRGPFVVWGPGDRELIAAARNALRPLLDEVERLRKCSKCPADSAYSDGLIDGEANLSDAIARAEAELEGERERLRANEHNTGALILKELEIANKLRKRAEAAEARVAALESEMVQLRNDAVVVHEGHREELVNERDTLRAALEKYGQHAPNCPKRNKCDVRMDRDNNCTCALESALNAGGGER